MVFFLLDSNEGNQISRIKTLFGLFIKIKVVCTYGFCLGIVEVSLVMSLDFSQEGLITDETPRIVHLPNMFLSSFV